MKINMRNVTGMILVHALCGSAFAQVPQIHRNVKVKVKVRETMTLNQNGYGYPSPYGTQPVYGNPVNAGVNYGNIPQINPASPGQYPIQPAYYMQWCNAAERILSEASGVASGLYHRNQFSQAKAVIEDGYNRAITAVVNEGPQNPYGQPGGFRPYTFQELARTIELINKLELTASPSVIMHDKMITYIALNRVSAVSKMAVLDTQYIIPCMRGCGYGGVNNISMNAFENALVSLVSDQLTEAQNLATMTVGNTTYPLVNGSVYFTLISSVANWAANDLSYALFSAQFGCMIQNLYSVSNYALQMQNAFGEPTAVQAVSASVDSIINDLNSSSYGCGRR